MLACNHIDIMDVTRQCPVQGFKVPLIVAQTECF